MGLTFHTIYLRIQIERAFVMYEYNTQANRCLNWMIRPHIWMNMAMDGGGVAERITQHEGCRFMPLFS